MDELTKAFYDVMYKYQKFFSAQGVAANLNAWAKNKGALAGLLRRHPGWSEKEQAIVFDLSISREIDQDIVDECKFALGKFVDESGLTAQQRLDFDVALAAATAEYSKFPSENNIDIIRARDGIKCASEQKTSRILGRLCNQFGISRHSRYNTVFARLADAFNPLQVQKTGVLSVHPCDFLEMSNKDNTWSSCHGLASGSYQSGCLSYLADSVSMIFFTVDDDVKSDFHKHPKRSRQFFCYVENLLLQSRLYPDDNDEESEQYRSLVQKAVAECLGAPNLCVCCGQPFRDGRLKCGCQNLVVCADCGETVPASAARYIEGAYYCNTCLHICTAYGNTVRTDMYPAYDRQGNLIEICGECYEAMIGACASCSVRPVCGVTASAGRLYGG